MTAEPSPHAVADGPESFAEEPAEFTETGSLDSELHSDFLSGSDKFSPHQHSSSSAAAETNDSLLENCFEKSGHEGELKQNSGSPLPASDVGLNSTPLPTCEMKLAPSGSEKACEVERHGVSNFSTARPDSSGTSTDLASDGETKGEPSLLEETSLLPQSINHEEIEAHVNAGQMEDSSLHKQLSPVCRSIGEGTEMLGNTVEDRNHLGPKEPAPDIVAPETAPSRENTQVFSSLPPVKKSTLRSLTTRTLKDDELKRRVVIPEYLSKGMVASIEAAKIILNERPRVNVQTPETALLVFINSKSGGRLGHQLEALLVDIISPAQVYDLIDKSRSPVAVFRYGLGYLEEEADAGDNVALEIRNNIRIMVAGGDGTVGWVLGSIAAELGAKERFKVPSVGVIPLGTGNDLSRSFRWGGSTSSVSRKAVKRCLIKATEAKIETLDSWQVIVKPAPTCQEKVLKLPHAMHPQHHIALEHADSGKEAAKVSHFEGFFWNYFSLGMDAQVAYGFHHLRDEAPWIASGRLSNQMVYGGYGCAQGWFCTPCATAPVARGIKQIAKVYIKKYQDTDGQWEDLEIPDNIRALVILNLQSYAGGRNPWGRPRSSRREKERYVEATCNDGIIEIVGLRDGWHTTFVLLDWFTAVRLGQARAIRLHLTGKGRRGKAYMQMDGEPWQQPLGGEHEPPAVVEISCSPRHSLCLARQ